LCLTARSSAEQALKKSLDEQAKERHAIMMREKAEALELEKRIVGTVAAKYVFCCCIAAVLLLLCCCCIAAVNLSSAFVPSTWTCV
jgi:hypothetical protein